MIVKMSKSFLSFSFGNPMEMNHNRQQATTTKKEMNEMINIKNIKKMNNEKKKTNKHRNVNIKNF